MSRRTSSRSTLTMVPSTMSPSLKYLMVASIAARKSSSEPMSLTATWGAVSNSLSGRVKVLLVIREVIPRWSDVVGHASTVGFTTGDDRLVPRWDVSGDSEPGVQLRWDRADLLAQSHRLRRRACRSPTGSLVDDLRDAGPERQH